MNAIIIRIAKRYAIRAVNDLLAGNQGNVTKITGTIGIWMERLSKVLDCLKRINARVADGRLEDEEVEESLKEVETLIREF